MLGFKSFIFADTDHRPADRGRNLQPILARSMTWQPRLAPHFHAIYSLHMSLRCGALITMGVCYATRNRYHFDAD